MDVFSAEQRSWIMGRVKSANTNPERAVRSLAHRLGYRFRLHRHDLPGTPDLVFPRHHKVVFVHGCFWHGHLCARGQRLPKTNSAYWAGKISRNMARDQASELELVRLGWDVLVIWECRLRDVEGVCSQLVEFLSQGVSSESG